MRAGARGRAERSEGRGDRLPPLCPGGEMGKRGRLKIAWPLAVQVRVLPRAPFRRVRICSHALRVGRRPDAELGDTGNRTRSLPVIARPDRPGKEPPRPFSRAVGGIAGHGGRVGLHGDRAACRDRGLRSVRGSRAGRSPVEGVGESLADVVGSEQLLERIPIEQRGALIVLIGTLDLDSEDLSRRVEDLSDAQGLVFVALEDLGSQRVHDAIAAISAETERIHRVEVTASRSSEELEGAGRSHGNAKHTRRSRRDSSTDRFEDVSRKDSTLHLTSGRRRRTGMDGDGWNRSIRDGRRRSPGRSETSGFPLGWRSREAAATDRSRLRRSRAAHSGMRLRVAEEALRRAASSYAPTLSRIRLSTTPILVARRAGTGPCNPASESHVEASFVFSPSHAA